MSDYFTSLIRTFVPVIVGTAAAWLVQHGLNVPQDVATKVSAALTVAAIAAYYAAVRALEARWPAFGWLLGKPTTPSYTE